jgi:hypothetical protein
LAKYGQTYILAEFYKRGGYNIECLGDFGFIPILMRRILSDSCQPEQIQFNAKRESYLLRVAYCCGLHLNHVYAHRADV